MIWIRCSVHTSDCEVVVVVVSEGYSADHDCDNTAHAEKLGHNVTQDAKNIGEGYLGDLAVDKEPAFFEYPGAEKCSEDAD